MSDIIERILLLSDEIREFPLGECSPSDDPDKQTAYIYSFLDLARRFIGSAKRLNSEQVQRELAMIDTNIQFITEAYDLRAELINVIDLVTDLNDESKLGTTHTSTISPQVASTLLSIIVENLASESANLLPMICENYGLRKGDVAEAFKSKRSYIHARTTHLQPPQIFEIASSMQGKYHDSQLDILVSDIQNKAESLHLVSQFERIKEMLIEELQQAKYTIWVAVAWFTDRDLANLLYKKSKQGVNVQIILNDDDINSALSSRLKNHFETYTVPRAMKRLMHNKFCIIDFKTVIHGSYNWTNKARYNNEAATKIQNRAEAERFSDEFIKLKNAVRTCYQ